MKIVVFANERMIGKIAWLVKVFPGANPLFGRQVSHLRRIKGKSRHKSPAQPTLLNKSLVWFRSVYTMIC
jgi:hypothetical protein